MFDFILPLSKFVAGAALVCAILPQTATGQTCPPTATGLCVVAHPTPGCADPVCCSTVCLIDPYCCMAAWDGQCAFIAQLNCQTAPPLPCGSAAAGLCNVVHSTPSCSDASCCEAVCSVYAFCCSVAWDQTCVAAANATCASLCTPACPPQSMAENEPCNTVGLGNSPCINGVGNTTLLTIENTKTVCGNFRFVSEGSTGIPDLDAYKLVLTDPNGDGMARLNIQIEAEYGTQESGTIPTFVALLSQPCLPLSSATISVQTTGCAVQQVTQCVPSGTWYVVVARGTFPAAQPFIYACDAVQNYNLKVTWDDQCSSPCGSTGDCFAKHGTAGCQVATCCNTVCAIDPVCCQKSWDQACVDIAVSHCNPPTPANDLCAQATPISLGEVPFTLVAATAGSNSIPAGCITAPNVVGADVWYRLQHVRGSVTVRTCGTGNLNTALMVYPYPCSATATAIACNDDNDLCPTNPLSALVNFSAQCGSEYLVRITSVNGSIGAGTLTVTSSLTACELCAGDYNSDGQRNGSDLATLLSAWNSPGGDVTGDGQTDGADLTLLLSGWGACP